MPGQHNVLNATAAVAVARELGVSDAAIRQGLAGFGGVRRRFTTVGVSHGIRVIDDYGHHPGGDRQCLEGRARAVVGEGRVIAVVQPHRYSRPARPVQRSSAPASTTPTPSSSPTSMRPASSPLRARTRPIWSRAYAASATAAPFPLDGPRRACRGLDRPGGQGGRPRGLPRRRRHHQLGLCPAGAAGRAEVRRCTPFSSPRFAGRGQGEGASVREPAKEYAPLRARYRARPLSYNPLPASWARR